MREPNRLFFALWPDVPVRAAAQAAARALKVKMQPGGYLSAPERYHLTLQFLGDFVPPDQQAAALAAAAQVRAAPFDLRLDHASSFKNPQIPWWLGPGEIPEALTRLYRTLQEHLTAARVSTERLRFQPHLTILRDAGLVLPRTPIPAIEWPVREFVLVRSRLDLKPVQYELLGRWPLQGGEAPPPAASQMALF